jgi:hypothetical protein
MKAPEQILEESAAQVAYPFPPSVAGRVVARIEQRTMRRRRRRRAVALAFALLLVAAAAVAATPAARSVFVDLFRLQGAVVERREAFPPVSEADFYPGRPVTLAEARDLVAFELLVPPSLGSPDEAYLSHMIAGGEVTLVWSDPYVLITEFDGRFEPDHVRKIVTPRTQVEHVSVGREQAVWVTGPHIVVFGEGDTRVSGNALLFEHGEVLVRIESGLGKEDMLELARSLSP